MKYSVDFEKEINSMLKNNIGLCPYFRSKHKFLKEYSVHYFWHNQSHLNYGMSYLRNLLKNETAFENPLFHILFKAFVYAEIRFINNFIPQNSHEERLTGHLISEISNSLSIIGETFEQKASQLYNSRVNLEFHYADLSSNDNEKITGADFGLIFHINLPDYQEKVNVAIIQSKKLGKNALIDLAQIDALKHFAEKSGFYCFYDMNKNEQYSPLILNANAITSIFDNDNKDSISYKSKSLQRDKITDSWNGGIPLSVFLILEMLNPENENIESFRNIHKAKRFIEGQSENVFKDNREHQVSRVLTVSVGGISNTNQDLRNLSELFKFQDYED
ncbi:MAG: hypothetical protein LBR68_03290 [Lachnoclostridium sp.]|jgi:hypothetical protein|nr:hypothetical protein [Lachnoclostridium sp.]